jgi:hypothetical protein
VAYISLFNFQRHVSPLPFDFGVVGDGSALDLQKLVNQAAYCTANNREFATEQGKSYLIDGLLDLSSIPYVDLRGRFICSGSTAQIKLGGQAQSGKSTDHRFFEVLGAGLSVTEAVDHPLVSLAGLKDARLRPGNCPWMEFIADDTDGGTGNDSSGYSSLYGGYVYKLTVNRKGTAWVNNITWYSPRISQILTADDGAFAHDGSCFLILNPSCENSDFTFNVNHYRDFHILLARLEGTGSSPGVVWGTSTEDCKITEQLTDLNQPYLWLDPITCPVTDLGKGNVACRAALENWMPNKVLHMSPRTPLITDGGTSSDAMVPGWQPTVTNFNPGPEYMQSGSGVVELIRTPWIDVEEDMLVVVRQRQRAADTNGSRPRLYLADSNYAPITAGIPAEVSSRYSPTLNAAGYLQFGASQGPDFIWPTYIEAGGTCAHVAVGIVAASAHQWDLFDITVWTPRAFLGTPRLAAGLKNMFAPPRSLILTGTPAQPIRRGLLAQKSDGISEFVQTTFVETRLSAANALAVLTVDSIAGISNGDLALLAKDDGTTFLSTVSGAPSGSSVTLASSPGTSVASAGRLVWFGKWITR